MPDFIKGSTATIYTTVFYQGRPVEDASVNVTVVDPTGTTIVDGESASPVVGEPGSYAFSLSPLNVVGTYSVTWNATYLGETFVTQTVFTVGFAPVGTVSLLDVRHALSLTELRDHWSGRVLAATSTTVTVPELSPYPDDSFNGAYIYIYGGAGRGQERVISDFSSGVFTVPAWNIVPDSTSLVEVHKKFSVASYNEAIRRAQWSVMERAHIPMSDSSTITVSGVTEYEVPAGFSFLAEVYADGNRVVPEDVVRDGSGWYVVPARRMLVVPDLGGGVSLELRGLARAGDIHHDSSLVEVSPEYLIYKAASILLRGYAGGPATDADAHFQRSAAYEALAERARQLMPIRTVPGMQRVD